MLLLLVVCLLGWVNSFKLAALNCTDNGGANKKYWYVFKQTYRELPDTETIGVLGGKVESIPCISDEQLQRLSPSRHGPIPHISSNRGNPDAIMSGELGKIRATIPNRMMHDIQLICQGCKNPAVMRWHNQLIAVSEVVR
jgi:hypothetical protein